MKRSDIGKGKVKIIFFSPLWEIKEKYLEMELDEDGFWLETALSKERFTRIKN